LWVYFWVLLVAVLTILALPSWAAVISDGDVDWTFIGNTGPGSMTIHDGTVHTPNSDMVLGKTASGKGTLTVQGPGTVWDGSAYNLDLDYNSSWLHVLSGGKVYVKNLRIAMTPTGSPNTGKTAIVRLDGADTLLSTGGGQVYVGTDGYVTSPQNKAMLTLTGGAKLETYRLALGEKGHVGIKVTGNDQLKADYFQTSGGTVYLLADNTLASGTYTPVKSMQSLSGPLFKAFGGTWDSGKLIVKDAITSVTGERISPMHWGDRAVITDLATGKQLTYSSEYANGPAVIQPIFNLLSEAELDRAQEMAPDQYVLDGWWHDIHVNAQAMFTLNIGLDQDVENLVFWQHHSYNDTWEKFVPDVWMYDADGTLSFTSSMLSKATGNPVFDGFVVTGGSAFRDPNGPDGPDIPEPATMALLTVGGTILLTRRQRMI